MLRDRPRCAVAVPRRSARCAFSRRSSAIPAAFGNGLPRHPRRLVAYRRSRPSCSLAIAAFAYPSRPCPRPPAAPAARSGPAPAPPGRRTSAACRPGEHLPRLRLRRAGRQPRTRPLPARPENGRRARGVEARPARPQPRALGQHRAGAFDPRRRPARARRPRCADRHHDPGRPSRVRHSPRSPSSSAS